MSAAQQGEQRVWYGSGEIRRDGRRLATVTYNIYRPGGEDESSAAEEARALKGSVIVAHGDRYLPVEEPCRLQLQDGRECLVALQSPLHPNAGKYAVRFLQPKELAGM